MINGQFPGPQIDTVTNENLIISVFNYLSEPFLISWYVLLLYSIISHFLEQYMFEVMPLPDLLNNPLKVLPFFGLNNFSARLDPMISFLLKKV